MIDDLIRKLQLQPHPEGGFYRERHRSPVSVTRADGKTRSALTVIDFLLPAGVVSAWHRVLGADETWHFAGGSPLELLRQETESDAIETLTLSPEQPWQIIPAGWWQSARSLGEWTLVNCCVAPGFSFDDFEMRH